MPHVDRPPKSGNTRQYQTEVAAGFIDILANEVDGDLDTIYSLCNGNLADDNIVANAHIAYSKLALAGQIKGSDIASGANIAGTAIQPRTLPADRVIAGALTATELADGAVSNAKLAASAVTLAKISPGQTVQDINRVEVSALTLPAANSWQLAGTVSWTARGGLGWIIAVAHCLVGTDQAAPAPGIQADLKVDNSTQDSITVDELTCGVTGALILPVTLNLQYHLWATAGSHTVTLYVTLLNRAVAFNKVKGGYIAVVEWA